MTYIYRLAGENLEIAKKELESVLKTEKIKEKPKYTDRLAETTKKLSQPKRLSLTHEITEKIDEIPVEKLEKQELDWKPEGSFSVRTKKITEETKDLDYERIIGNKLSDGDNTVDLEKPETEVIAYILEDKIILGKLKTNIDRGLFGERSNEKRPFSSPVSLDPVHARLMVNLSEAKKGEKLLDPFCGTGGILIEAGLCGIQVQGADIKKEMVEGTKENLENYGIIKHEIKQVDALESLEAFDEPDVLVTDLPYGKSSKIQGNLEDKIRKLIKQFDDRIVFMYNKPNFAGLDAKFKIYVHKNLTRYVFIN